MTDFGRLYGGVILDGTVHITDMDELATLCTGRQALDGTGADLVRATCGLCLHVHRSRCTLVAGYLDREITAAIRDAGRAGLPGRQRSPRASPLEGERTPGGS